MPGFNFDAFSALSFDKNNATARINAFMASNPNASLDEIDSKVKEIIISETLYAINNKVLTEKDPKKDNADYVSQKQQRIQRTFLNSSSSTEAKALQQLSYSDIIKHLSYIQDQAEDAIDAPNFQASIKNKYSPFLDAMTYRDSTAPKSYSNWRGYDKAFFAVKPDISGAYLEGNKNKEKYDSWLSESENIILEPPAEVGDKLAEFVVFGELMRPETLEGNKKYISIGSTIIGEQDVVADTLNNFFSNTIIGDGRPNMQGIRTCVPLARKNANEVLKSKNMDRIKEDLKSSFDIMFGQAMDTSKTDQEFIYPVVKINELILACEQKGLNPNELFEIDDAKAQRLEMLNMKYSLAKRQSDLRVELGEKAEEYLLSNGAKDPKLDPVFMDKLAELNAIHVALATCSKEVNHLNNGYLDCISKREKSNYAAKRDFTFSEKQLMNNPQKYIQWIQNNLVETKQYKDFVNNPDPSTLFCNSAPTMFVTEFFSDEPSLGYYGFEKLEQEAMPFKLDEIEKLANQSKTAKVYIEGSLDGITNKINEIREKRKETEGMAYEQRSQQMIPLYNELVNEKENFFKKYDLGQALADPNINALYTSFEAIEFYIKKKDFEAQYAELTNTITEAVQNTELKEAVVERDEEPAPIQPAKKKATAVKFSKPAKAPEAYLKQAQKELKDAVSLKGKNPDINDIKLAYAKVLTSYTLGKFRDQTVAAKNQGAIGTDEIMKDIMSNDKYNDAVEDLLNSKEFTKLCKNLSSADIKTALNAKDLKSLDNNYGKLLDIMKGPKAPQKVEQQPQAGEPALGPM